MTRRGSLVYYLSAWVLGCFFMAACLWLVIRSSMQWYVAGFLGFFVFSLFFGAFAALLFGILLRALNAWAGFSRLWQWVAGGAGLSLLLVLGLGAMGEATIRKYSPGTESTTLQYALLLMLGGPAVVFDEGSWLAIPAGAATASVLYFIHRAFELRPYPLEL